MAQEKTTKESATQEFIDVEKIREGVIVLKNGGLRSILMCGSRNLELESTDSQNAIISIYADFLNSFDWPLQIVIHSRKLDIEPYLATLGEKLKNQKNELLKIQTAEYIDFVRKFVTLSDIMTKKFYIVVPFDPVESKTEGPFEKLSSLIKTSSQKTPELSEEKFQEYKSQLFQRVDHVLSALTRTGIKAIGLQTEELIELFYNLYNPGEYGPHKFR